MKRIKADDEVDELFVSIRNRIVELIKSEHCSGDVAVDALMIVKYLEKNSRPCGKYLRVGGILQDGRIQEYPYYINFGG